MATRTVFRHPFVTAAALAFLLLPLPRLPAQAPVPPAGGGRAAAVIVYHEGQDFEVHSRGGLIPGSADSIGLELAEGDVLITYDDTFVELRLLPSGNVVKIAENTDFRLEALSERRESRFSMLYGSVRARVGRLLQDEKFTIRGSSAVAGVRGTDFGMDVLIPRTGSASDTVTRVYCFDGEVEVRPVEAPPEQAVAVGPQEMVVVSALPEEGPPRVVPLAPELRLYWDEHPFRDLPLRSGPQPAPDVPAVAVVPAAPVVSIAAPAPPPVEVLLAGLETERRRSLTAGGLTLSLGMLLETAGLWSFYMIGQGSPTGGRFDWDEAATALTVSGAFCLSGSLLFFVDTWIRGAELRRLKTQR